MPSTFSPNLRFEEIQNGEQSNTWGTTTNNNIGNLIEQAIAGLTQIDVTGSDQTLLALDGAVDQARSMFIEVIGTPSATRNVYCPDGDTKVYIVINNSNSPVVFSTVSGTGVSIPAAGHQFLYSDGTDVYDAVTSVYTFAASKALVSSSGGNIDVSATTAQQIGWLSNVTSDVQTQLNSKLPTTTGTTAQLLANDGAGGLANVNVGSGLQYVPATNTLSSLSGGGSVTSVAMTVPSGFTLSGSPITGAGTLALGISPSLNNTMVYVNSAGALAQVSFGGGLSFAGGTLTATAAGLTSFQGRTSSAAVLYGSDVTGALGYTPVPTTGAGASGTWGINIAGNAATATSANSASTASTASYASSAGSASTASSATTATSAGTTTSNVISNYGGTNYLIIDGLGQVNTNSHPFVCGDTLTVYGNSQAVFGASGSSAAIWYNAGGYLEIQTGLTGGVKLNPGATAWASASDETIKDVIEPIENAEEKVNTLRAVIGKFKDDPADMRRSFLIAQDVLAVLPEAVSVDPEGAEPMSLRYTEVIPLLVAAIKELSAKIEALEAKVGA